MLRVILDTNVIVSGLLHSEGTPAVLLKLAVAKQFRCFVSESLLVEYTEVLGRRYFRLDRQRVVRFMKDFSELVVVVAPRKKLAVSRDSGDDKVLECAVEARADFIITGNTRDFPMQYHGVRVVKPKDFLFVLGSLPKPL